MFPASWHVCKERGKQSLGDRAKWFMKDLPGLWPPFTHRFCDTDRTNVLYLPGVMGTRCVSSAPKDNLVSCNVWSIGGMFCGTKFVWDHFKVASCQYSFKSRWSLFWVLPESAANSPALLLDIKSKRVKIHATQSTRHFHWAVVLVWPCPLMFFFDLVHGVVLESLFCR